MLVELSVMEQRYQAVLSVVQDGWKVVEVARRVGVSARVLFAKADPTGILTSAPGIGPVIGAQILGRLGDPTRFRSLAGLRSFSGLVPSLDASGLKGHHGGPTKRGDACLREAIFMAADHARRIDPTLAALCHVAATLLTRVVSCWRRGEHYVIRDVDGRVVNPAEGKRIVDGRYTIPSELRSPRFRKGVMVPTGRTGQRSQESLGAPSPGPSERHATALKEA